jgi:hypothetical protein
MYITGAHWFNSHHSWRRLVHISPCDNYSYMATDRFSNFSSSLNPEIAASKRIFLAVCLVFYYFADQRFCRYTEHGRTQVGVCATWQFLCLLFLRFIRHRVSSNREEKPIPVCTRRALLFSETELAVRVHLCEGKVTKEIVMECVRTYSLYLQMCYITSVDMKCKKGERKQTYTRK